MGGLKGVSIMPLGTGGRRHGGVTMAGGMLATRRGSSGRHPVPRHAEKSQVCESQQSQGGCPADGERMASQGAL